MTEVEFLIDVYTPADKLGSFVLDVLLHDAVNVVGDGVAKMKTTINPREVVTTQRHIPQLSLMEQECYAFGLAFYWVCICVL